MCPKDLGKDVRGTDSSDVKHRERRRRVRYYSGKGKRSGSVRLRHGGEIAFLSNSYSLRVNRGHCPSARLERRGKYTPLLGMSNG